MIKHIKSTLSINDLKLSQHKSKQSAFNKNVLATAISLALSLTLSASEIHVTEANDDGTGLIFGTLSEVIYYANINGKDDVIVLKTDVTITGVMKRLIDSNLTIRSDDIRRTIDGASKFRPLFIKSGNVVIENIDMVNGLAQGGSSFQGGSGAGMGGSIFVYDGNVRIENVSISNSKAIAGQTAKNGWPQISGAGGMFGNGARNGGGGLFESAYHSNDYYGYGAYGGYGYYRNNDPKFGEGGGFQFNCCDRSGGFGGGGASLSFNIDASYGGFGGGGGYGYYGGEDGGFGGGGGLTNSNRYEDGFSGYGGHSRYAAGMGGAIFVRSGNLNLSRVTIENSHAIAKDGAKGLGGALFIMHSTANSNGNNQGMPSVLPTVSGCSLVFNGNTASGDTNTNDNNDNIFDLANNFENLPICEDVPIFINGFESFAPVQFIQSVPESKDAQEQPFFDSEFKRNNDEGFTAYKNVFGQIEPLQLNEVFAINNPNGDWYADFFVNFTPSTSMINLLTGKIKSSNEDLGQ